MDCPTPGSRACTPSCGSSPASSSGSAHPTRSLPWPCSTSAACAHPYPAARSPDHAHGSSTRAGFGRRDLQQGDEFAGGGQLVVDEAVVGKLSQFLDPNAGVAQHVDRGQRPERLVFLQAQVASFAVPGSSAQVLPTVAWVVPERRIVCPATVNVSPAATA